MKSITKKILILIGVILVFTIALLGYFFLQSKELRVNNLFRLIPNDASVIIESDNLNGSAIKLVNENQIFKTIFDSPDLIYIKNQIVFIDSIINKNKSIFPVNEKNSSLMSFHIIGKNNIEILYALQLSKIYSSSEIKDLIERMLTDSGTVNSRNYDEYEIFEIASANNNSSNNLSFVAVGDAVLFSFSSILIEDALRQYKTQFNLMDNPDFNKVFQTAGDKVAANVFINFKEFPRFLSLFLANKHQRNVASFINFATWAELDVHIKPNQLLMNGFVHGNDSLGNFIHCLISQSPGEMEFATLLPTATGSFIALNIDNYKLWQKNLGLYYEKEGLYSEFKEPLQNFKNKYKTDIEEVISEIFDEEIIAFYYDEPNMSFDDRNFVALKVKSASQAKEIFINLAAKVMKISPDSSQKIVSSVNIDEEVTEDMIVCAIPYFARLTFGNAFSRNETRYLTFIDNYMVFGNSKEALKQLHYNKLLKKTMDSDKSFAGISESLNNRSNFIFYSNFNKSIDYLSFYLNEPILKHFQSQKDSYKNMDAITVQLVSSKNMMYSNILLTYSQTVREKAVTIWESRLDTLFIQKPFLVVNHNTDEKEIIVQDEKNQLYLLSSSGRVIWKVPLPEKIMGDIQQIDIFKNSKLQYAFNTKSYLYVIDRNGNNVDRFPVKLRANATNTLSIFDYENSRDYRMFIACNDKKIYCYGADGNILPGWEFNKSDNTIYQPLQHFKVNDKDFIVFNDTLKTYIVDRKGNMRIKLAAAIPTDKYSKISLDVSQKNNEYFLINDVNGNIHQIFMDGKTKKIELTKFNEPYIFDYIDINSDNKPDYCFYGSQSFTVYDNSKKLLFSYVIKSDLTKRPSYYILPGNKRRIGLVSENKLHLIDSKGSLHSGFPLIGNTPFSIGKFSKDNDIFNLVTGNIDGFLLNYEVKY